MMITGKFYYIVRAKGRLLGTMFDNISRVVMKG